MRPSLGALCLVLLALCPRTARALRVACELTLGADVHSVAVGVADGNTTVAQLAGLAGGKLVKKLRLRRGLVLSDLETEGAWLDPDDQLWPLETAHGLSVEGRVVGLAEEEGAPSGLVKDVPSWRTLVDDEGHWLHDVGDKYGFSCTLAGGERGGGGRDQSGASGGGESLAGILDTAAEVHNVLDSLAQPTEPQDEAIDFWADEAMLILEQLRLEGPLESEDPVMMPETETAAQIGDWLSSALAGTGGADGDEDEFEEEQWGGIILDDEEEERYWAQHEAEMEARASGEADASSSAEEEAEAADPKPRAEADATDELPGDSATAAAPTEKTGGSSTPAKKQRSRRRKRALSDDGESAAPDSETDAALAPDANGCTTFACHYACPPGTKKTGLSQNCCGDGLCLALENEERCPVDCAGVIVNGMIGPGTYIDPSVQQRQQQQQMQQQQPAQTESDASNADERVPMAREEAGTMLMQDGKQALPVVWVPKSRIDEYRAQGFRTLENLLGTTEPLPYAPHPQQEGGQQQQPPHGIPFDPTKTTASEAQAQHRVRQQQQQQSGKKKRAWSTQMPTQSEIEQSKVMARRAAGAIQCNTCLFLLQDLWGKVLGVGANTEEQQAIHRMQFGTENDIMAAVEKMCGAPGAAAPFRGAYLLEEAKDCATHPLPGCGHQGFSLRRRQPPLPADIVPLSWRTDALKLACNDLSNALDVEIAEKFYSLTNGKAIYQLSREEVLKLKVTEKDMIVDLCSDRCVGLTIKTSATAVAQQGSGPSSGLSGGQIQHHTTNGRVVNKLDLKRLDSYPVVGNTAGNAAQMQAQQHRLNQMNQPVRTYGSSSGQVWTAPGSVASVPQKQHQHQQAAAGENAKQPPHSQSAIHASVVVNAAINAANHDQVPQNQKAKTVLDALEHRTLSSHRAKQQQQQQQRLAQQQQQHQSMTKAQYEANVKSKEAYLQKKEMEQKSGQDAAAKLLDAIKQKKEVAATLTGQTAEELQAAEKRRTRDEEASAASAPAPPVRQDGTDHAETSKRGKESPKVAPSAPDAIFGASVRKKAMETAEQDTEEDEAAQKKKKEKKDRKTKGGKGKGKKSRKKTAKDDL